MYGSSFPFHLFRSGLHTSQPLADHILKLSSAAMRARNAVFSRTLEILA